MAKRQAKNKMNEQNLTKHGQPAADQKIDSLLQLNREDCGSYSCAKEDQK
ncbi:hypothetical protein [Ammoniphilus oxalaticus]|nr:hypothetical protein [Ammoniphilus oxalaticus]